MTCPADVEGYLAGLPSETRRAVDEVRALIRDAAPLAIERISYGIPTFILEGRPLLYVAGWKKHVSVYPVTPAMERELGSELDPFRTGKGTLQFTLAKPIPTELIRSAAVARRAEIAG